MASRGRLPECGGLGCAPASFDDGAVGRAEAAPGARVDSRDGPGPAAPGRADREPGSERRRRGARRRRGRRGTHGRDDGGRRASRGRVGAPRGPRHRGGRRSHRCRRPPRRGPRAAGRRPARARHLASRRRHRRRGRPRPRGPPGLVRSRPDRPRHRPDDRLRQGLPRAVRHRPDDRARRVHLHRWRERRRKIDVCADAGGPPAAPGGHGRGRDRRRHGRRSPRLAEQAAARPHVHGLPGARIPVPGLHRRRGTRHRPARGRHDRGGDRPPRRGTPGGPGPH